VIYLVTQNGNLWAYGIMNIGNGDDLFCCDATELGSTVYDASVDTRGGNETFDCAGDTGCL